MLQEKFIVSSAYQIRSNPEINKVSFIHKLGKNSELKSKRRKNKDYIKISETTEILQQRLNKEINNPVGRLIKAEIEIIYTPHRNGKKK